MLFKVARTSEGIAGTSRDGFCACHGQNHRKRGPFGSGGGLALDRNALRQLTAPAANYGLHPACANLQAMANGTGAFAGKRRLAFVANVGTLVQPITKAQFNAWENGQNAALPVPKALFSQRPERCRRRESSHFRTHVCVSCSDLGQHGTTPKVPIGGVDAQPGGE